ncbi:hypothetical protein DPMN_190331 [Dreissena polymorpha]|uniref:Uncharacterized protein n=1 Tax=Dreissena polymorpha TaxID=45954 RepID=A0A9D4ID83_DREPO|nr:hypothetical protein DPMN_190331 [Dreissena polymorpha]
MGSIVSFIATWFSGRIHGPQLRRRQGSIVSFIATWFSGRIHGTQLRRRQGSIATWFSWVIPQLFGRQALDNRHNRLWNIIFDNYYPHWRAFPVRIRRECLGVINLHHCDIEKIIPIYLIVSGVLTLLFGSLIAKSFRRRDKH